MSRLQSLSLVYLLIPCVSSSVAVDVVVVIMAVVVVAANVVVVVAALLVVYVVDTGLVAGVLHLKLHYSHC